MRFGICTLDDYELRGKTVLCRVDINQPVDRESGTLRDITRIRACAPTLRELSDAGARVVILAHQGSDIEYGNFYTTRPHAAVLAGLLERPVRFVEDVCGPAARGAIAELRDGELLLLDNVRFQAEEQTLFERALRLSHAQQADTQVVRALAPLADLFVCDAFAAAHRDQPSLCGFPQRLPAAMGRLFEAEYCVVSELLENPARPCVFVLGGAKVADAFAMMRAVLERGTADRILAGGLVANILLAGRGEQVGAGSLDFIRESGYGEFIESSKALYQHYADRILLPVDAAWLERGRRAEGELGEIPSQAAVLDIGGETARRYAAEIGAARTVFVNGPMGVFEQAETEHGTRAVWEALAATKAHTVLGGGDSIAATNKYGLAERMDYLCTGGGALIRFLSGEELPVVRALRHGSAAHREVGG